MLQSADIPLALEHTASSHVQLHPDSAVRIHKSLQKNRKLRTAGLELLTSQTTKNIIQLDMNYCGHAELCCIMYFPVSVSPQQGLH